MTPSFSSFTPPPSDCRLCPRLHDFLKVHAKAHPEWHNAPVDAMGSLEARILIVGLAPGLRGANVTGRPFTGDSAGGYLFEMLLFDIDFCLEHLNLPLAKVLNF